MILIIFLVTLLFFPIDNFNSFEDINHGCCGFIGTGSSINDGKSLLFKHRWLDEFNQRPIFFKGDNYTFWGIGDGLNSFCRMGLNEEGLSIANFDPPVDNIDEGLWEFVSDHSSKSEDHDMMTVLGNFSKVSDAAYWLANHASYPCQWIIISAEPCVGAVVAMDYNYHVNISWVNNTWAAIGNNWYCENYKDSWYINRIRYLISFKIKNNLMYDHLESDKIGLRDLIRTIGKDQNASDMNYPWYSEPKPDFYSGSYNSDGIAGWKTCHASIAVISGDKDYGGSTSTAWISFADTTPLGIYLPLGSSYIKDSNDIYFRWLDENSRGLQKYTDIKKNYVEVNNHVFDRARMHNLQNYSVLIENFTFDAYEEFLNGLSSSLSNSEIEYRLKQFCDVFTENGLKFYIKSRSISYNKYDINFDGEVGLIDFLLSFLHVVKNDDYKWYYDVNNDDIVDFTDVKLIWDSK